MTTPRIYVDQGELAAIRALLRSVIVDEKVFVFGSRARGDHKKTSDLDIAIEGNEPLSLSKRATLELAFSESALPFRVDIVDLHTVDAGFRSIILRDGVPLSLAV
jgi:predicted nucleotidyltransferase